MARQHAAPILLEADRLTRLIPLSLGYGPDQVSEAELQEMLHRHPECLPIQEVDPLFKNPIPICMELNTQVGPIDNFMLTASGLPVLVECKLWRNPEGRREVVGQILDYAKELTKWTASDVQREAARRLRVDGNPLLTLIGKAGHIVDEVEFNDALTYNLRRGRFLLLIVGDGIREGVESIAEYLQGHAGLHFSFGLVELPIYLLPDGSKLAAPRVVAKTELITRTVIEVPMNHLVRDNGDTPLEEDNDPLSRINFWTEFVRNLRLDDPDQAPPRPTRQGYVLLSLPVPGGTAWLTSYRMEAKYEVGVYLGYTRDSIGARAVDRVIADWNDVSQELGGTVALSEDKNGRTLITDQFRTGSWHDPAEKDRALAWLRERTNDFVNVLRPRIRMAVANIEGVS